MTSASGGARDPIRALVEAFHRLPGIGPKSAQRLAYHLLRVPLEEAQALASAITEVRARIKLCSSCMNLTELDPCSLCGDPGRDPSLICVVEQPLDVAALERSGGFEGRYHVLHGVINPMDGVGPEDLRIKELVTRLGDGSVTEVIMATNPSLEGEATAIYVSRLLAPMGIRVTRLARGLPSGADLEYTDDLTLSRALEGRQEIR
ncbi:MAG: recombination mediator RecR [Dehalococcoidia bacterium]